MTLGFQTQWGKEMGELAGKPTYFPWKILEGIASYTDIREEEIERYFNSIVAMEPPPRNDTPKLHTIRHDPHNRWREGMNIHFVINNRTKNRFQFAPVVKCTGVQEIEIEWESRNWVVVKIDKKPIQTGIMGQVAFNDGFDTIYDFLRFFAKPFKGKIIHWANLKY